LTSIQIPKQYQAFGNSFSRNMLAKANHCTRRYEQNGRLVVALFDFFRLSAEPVKKMIDADRIRSKATFLVHMFQRLRRA